MTDLELQYQADEDWQTQQDFEADQDSDEADYSWPHQEDVDC